MSWLEANEEAGGGETELSPEIPYRRVLGKSIS